MEDLLNLIQSDAPSGQNLRYEPVYDQITEARLEDDATLPVGQWARQAKKADYQLVASLAHNALAKRSKDLWLAVWLGEAQIKLDGLSVLSSVLDMLLELQRQFWDSLYPEIDDGDHGLRAAPLQWAMTHYSNLVYELSIIAESVSYRDYKAVRTPSLNGSTTQWTPETLDAALEGTGKVFYVSVENDLAASRESLEKLYLFCDEKYRDDGPSFVKLRTAVDEVYNLVASLLRAKRERDPDPIKVESPAPQTATSIVADVFPAQPAQSEEAQAPVALEAKPETQASLAVPLEPESQTSTAVTAQSQLLEPRSWEEAIESIRNCVAYLAKERPSNPIPYLLLGAMHCGELKADGVALLQEPPPTEVRMALKKTSHEGGGQLLLDAALHALALPCGGLWLDLHRYIWSASREAGYQAIAESVLDIVRILLQQNESFADSVFEDDTPIASLETKQWIEAEVKLYEQSALIEVEEETVVPQVPGAVTISMPAAEQIPVQEEAEALAAAGDLKGSIQLLMQDAVASPARRLRFQRRLQIARLCLKRGQKIVACRLLEHLLTEADEYRLESWEGPQLVGEVIAMLLQSLDVKDGLEAERRALLARLCRIDPAQALNLEAQV